VPRKLFLTFTVVAALLAAGSAFAHHGTAGYDMVKVVTVKGTVTKVDWNNPHVIFHIDGHIDGHIDSNDGGDIQHWSMEVSPPLLMNRFGWNKESLKPGDQVSAETHPARNGSPVGISGTASFLLRFVVNGTPLPHLP
jgi:hypothetical protein